MVDTIVDKPEYPELVNVVKAALGVGMSKTNEPTSLRNLESVDPAAVQGLGFSDKYDVLHVVTDWDEWHELGRSKSLSARCPYRPGTDGTVLRVDGEDHMRRRRVLGTLLRHGGHQWFRDTVLIPTAHASIQELLAHPEPDGVVPN